MTGLAVFVALAAVLAAVAFFLQSRSARQITLQRAAEVEKLRREVESVRAELSAIRAEAKERRDEAAGLRTELGAAKKKAFEQAEAAKKAGGAAALRVEIDKLNARVAEARAEAAHHAERAKTLELAAEKQAKEVERLRAQADRPAPAPAAPIPAPAPAAAAAEVQAASAAQPGVELARFEAEKDRADKAEAKLVETRKKLAEVERDLRGVRGRLETEKRVYMVQKGELELAGDRYAELRRRHDALRKDHEELVEAVRQAAQEERRMAEAEKAAPAEAELQGAHAAPSPPAKPSGTLPG
jgi:colicin import membrane protein